MGKWPESALSYHRECWSWKDRARDMQQCSPLGRAERRSAGDREGDSTLRSSPLPSSAETPIPSRTYNNGHTSGAECCGTSRAPLRVPDSGVCILSSSDIPVESHFVQRSGRSPSTVSVLLPVCRGHSHQHEWQTDGGNIPDRCCVVAHLRDQVVTCPNGPGRMEISKLYEAHECCCGGVHPCASEVAHRAQAARSTFRSAA